MSLLIGVLFLLVIASLIFYIFQAQICAFYKSGRCLVASRFMLIIVFGFTFAFMTCTRIFPASQIPGYNLFSCAQNEDSTSGLDTSQKVRIACLVMTFQTRHDTLSKAVKETWGRHCNVLLFFSDIRDDSIPTIDAQAGNQVRGPWVMTIFALRYIREHYEQQIDWVYKCDDDTYAIMENMRDLVVNISTETPAYLGFHVKAPSWFMSGGAGYLINKATWHLILDQGLNGSYSQCMQNFTAEDLVMGQCLKSLGVNFTDTRDSQGRERFFTEPVSSHAYPYNDLNSYPFPWLTHYSYYPTNFGLNCCAEDPISFHHLGERNMYELEYLIYGIRHPRPQILLHNDILPN